MGRSSKEEAARTRVRIIDTASELFRASGVEQVSVSDVMGALGLTTGGFYKHFASKEALVTEAVGLAFAQSTSAWQDAVACEATKTRSRRAKLVEHYLRPNPATRCPMIAFAPHATMTEDNTPSHATYCEGVERLLDGFVEDVNVDGSSPTITAPQRDARVLFAAMIGARVLKEPAGDAAWVNDLRAAVLNAAAMAA